MTLPTYLREFNMVNTSVFAVQELKTAGFTSNKVNGYLGFAPYTIADNVDKNRLVKSDSLLLDLLN